MGTCRFLLLFSAAWADIDVRFDVDVQKDLQPISPYVYGTNTGKLGAAEGVTFSRSGGNRLTGYNWENNASNAGLDWYHQSDALMGGGETPGKSMIDFHDGALAAGRRSLITLPAAGYVAKDKSGPVSEAETAPSPRWAKVVFRKGAPFSDPPAAGDGEVYVDEFVDFMVRKYGNASTARGVKSYSVDNEPGLWASTHPRLHPAKAGAAELVARTAELSAAVKRVDPHAEIFGGVFYGWMDFASLQEAPDWNTVKGSHAWYVDYFLEEMRKASEKEGRRLLDVLDVHWYPEARGDNRISEDNATTPADQRARVQAPRSLWDSAYVESSWISQWMTQKPGGAPGPVMLLSRLFKSVRRHYPGTKVAITEYNYGGNKHVSGGLATADFLGVLGRMGVHAANLWELGDGVDYAASAFRLFRNYDGAGAAYPSLAARASASDPENASVYAAFEPGGSALHLIVLNKSATETLRGSFHVASPIALTQGKAWGFDAAGTALQEKAPIPAITGNAFTYTLPPLSARHLVIGTASALPVSARLAFPRARAGEGTGRAYLPDGRAPAPARGKARVPLLAPAPDSRRPSTE